MNPSPRAAKTERRFVPGLLALAFYLTHAFFWVLYGAASNALWACHLGTLLVSLGWLRRAPLLNGIGSLWLAMGNLLWISDLLAGATFYPTSALTHLGGIGLGVWGMAEMGLPRRTWLCADLGLAPLWLATRLVTDPSENVNMAFRVYSGWETRFPSYRVFLVLLLAAAGLLFFTLEKALKSWQAARSR